MVRITSSAAQVVHGHAKKAGSATDKAPGAVIKSYPFSKYGRAGAIKKAHAMHYAIVKSEERQKSKDHVSSGDVAVRGAVQDVSVAYKPAPINPKQGQADQPLSVGTNRDRVEKMPITDTRDGKVDMTADIPFIKPVPDIKPSDDAQSDKFGPDKYVLNTAEAKDLNGLEMGPGSDPQKSQPVRPALYHIPPLSYAEDEPEFGASEALKALIIRIFTKETIKDDEQLHNLAVQLAMEPEELEEAVYETLGEFLAKGVSNEKDGVKYDPEQMKLGIAIEMEHTTNPMMAAKIARDHLAEHPNYYDVLIEAEKIMEPSDYAEISMAVETVPAVGLGYQKDAKAMTIPGGDPALRQDGTQETVQNRDKPLYNEEDDEEDEELEGEDSQWVECFRAGQFTDSDGQTRKWDPGDMQKIAQQYNAKASPANPERKLAPVVLGHPKDDAPAYGWIEKVKVQGNTLKAKITQLNKDFVQALKDGAYKTRSISLYPDLNIRHIGFLGAVQPAVPGLGPFKFAEGKASTIEFEEFSMPIEDVKSLQKENRFFKKLFSLFKIDVSKEAMDHAEEKPVQTTDHAGPDPSSLGLRVPETRSALPGYDQKGEATMAESKIVAPGEAEKSVPIADIKDTKDELTTLREKLTACEAELQKCKQERDAFAAELGSKEVRERTQNHKEYCEKLIGEGRLRPIDLEQTILNMELRYREDSGVSNFAETKSTPTLDNYKTYLAACPKIVDFSEIATPKTASNLSATESPMVKVQKMCDEYISKNPKMSYSEALQKCGEEHPDDMASYFAEMGFARQ